MKNLFGFCVSSYLHRTLSSENCRVNFSGRTVEQTADLFAGKKLFYVGVCPDGSEYSIRNVPPFVNVIFLSTF